MQLYTYYRSSAAYRVRIALNLKQLPYTAVPVNLLEGEQLSKEYGAVNPQALVPCLKLEDGSVISQSGAILEWLEECYPEPPLLPAQARDRATVRGMINHIACDIHPLNNISILFYLRDQLQAEPGAISDWYSQWIHRGFTGLETQVREGDGEYCWGREVSLADCYLIPQVYNAMRFNVDINPYPALMSVFHHCNTLEAFQHAHPDQQADNPN